MGRVKVPARGKDLGTAMSAPVDINVMVKRDAKVSGSEWGASPKYFLERLENC